MNNSARDKTKAWLNKQIKNYLKWPNKFHDFHEIFEDNEKAVTVQKVSKDNKLKVFACKECVNKDVRS